MVTESRRRTSQLLVSKVTEADAGNYTCAPAESKTDSVTVHVIKGESFVTRGVHGMIGGIFIRCQVVTQGEISLSLPSKLRERERGRGDVGTAADGEN